MSTTLKVSLVTIVCAVAAFILGPIIWHPAEADGPGSLLPFFIIVSAMESIALGLGVSFLLFGWKWVTRVTHDTKTAAKILYVAIAWSLVSWWPHDNMHISNAHDNWGRLLMIEYMFHVTLIAAAIGMAWSFLHLLKKQQGMAM
jgi:hypothetical protein